MTETQIARENVEDYEKQKYQLNPNKQIISKFICINHKATCQRWLEFLEIWCDFKRTKVREKIRDLKKAIEIYEKNE